MSTNVERADRAASCLAHYEDLAGPLALEEAIPDLVADIGHFCVENDLTYLYILARGISHWRREMTDPESLDPLALALTAETGGTVAMLLNLASLCHSNRHDLWLQNPPAVIYGLDELVCWPEGKLELARSTTATHRHCWVVWKPDHTGGSVFK